MKALVVLRDLVEERNMACEVLGRSASHVTDMQAATSHVQRDEVPAIDMDGMKSIQ